MTIVDFENTRTFTGHAYLARFTNDFRNLLGLLDFGRNQFFELNKSCMNRTLNTQALLTKEIFTDCDRACDSDNFVLRWLQKHSEEMKRQFLHVTRPFPKCDYIIVYPLNTFRLAMDKRLDKAYRL